METIRPIRVTLDTLSILKCIRQRFNSLCYRVTRPQLILGVGINRLVIRLTLDILVNPQAHHDSLTPQEQGNLNLTVVPIFGHRPIGPLSRATPSCDIHVMQSSNDFAETPHDALRLSHATGILSSLDEIV